MQGYHSKLRVKRADPHQGIACRCGAVEVEVREAAGTLRLFCRGCGAHLRDVAPSQYAYYPGALDLSASQQLPLEGKTWWLALLRGKDGVWRPVAAAETLAGAWDALQCGWAAGDLLMMCQRGQLPEGDSSASGFKLPVVPEVEDDDDGRDEQRCRGGGSRTVPCTVDYVRLQSGPRLVDGIEVTCSRCENIAESYGQHQGSINRALALLRETCPHGEKNFYVQE